MYGNFHHRLILKPYSIKEDKYDYNNFENNLKQVQKTL